jgi:hypothetical protein
MALCRLAFRHIARLGLVYFLVGCLMPGPSMAATDTIATKTLIDLHLPTDVAAGAMLLSTMAAELVSASESAADVAQVATLAFPNLEQQGGLRAAINFGKDWHNASLAASKESYEVVDRLHR